MSTTNHLATSDAPGTPPNTLVQIADHSFDESVVQSKVPVLLAFCADGCSASQRLLRLLAAATPRCRGGAKIINVNLAKSPKLAVRFNIVSAPCLLLLRDQTVCYQFIGELSRRELEELLDRTLGRRQLPTEPCWP